MLDYVHVCVCAYVFECMFNVVSDLVVNLVILCVTIAGIAQLILSFCERVVYLYVKAN